MKADKKQNAEKNRVVLTGGHAATTALATVEELIRDGKWDIYWIGSGKAMEGKDVPSLESEIFPKIGISSHKIISGRLQRRLTFWTLPSIAKIPIGFFHAIFFLLKIRPRVILSFGGHAAFPVVVAGFFLRIPVAIHEQTSAAGRANIFSARFAKKIALARGSSHQYFPENKTKIIGNPILTQITEVKPKTRMGRPPTIFITGGSRGSQTVNTFVVEILDKLLDQYTVIHQTGSVDYEKIRDLRNSLPKDLKNKYEIYKMIDPMDMDGIYQRADIIIARGGANTVSEIIFVKRPAVLIPIPWSYENEQAKNAEFAETFGVAKVLDQEEMTAQGLLAAIKEIEDNWSEIVNKIKDKESPDIDAAKRLVNLLEGIVK